MLKLAFCITLKDSLISRIYYNSRFTIAIFCNNYSIAEVTYLLNRFNKTTSLKGNKRMQIEMLQMNNTHIHTTTNKHTLGKR